MVVVIDCAWVGVGGGGVPLINPWLLLGLPSATTRGWNVPAARRISLRRRHTARPCAGVVPTPTSTQHRLVLGPLRCRYY